MNNWSFRYQIIFLGTIPALLTWVALTINTVYTSWETLSEAHQRHGQMLVNQIAPSCEFALFSRDMEPLNRLLQKSIQQSDILQIEVYDNQYHLLSQVGERHLQPLSPELELDLQLTFSAPIYSSIININRSDNSPIQDNYLGSVSITLSAQPILDTREQIFIQALWSGGAALLLATLLVLFLSHRFTTVFIALRSAMRQIATGDFSPPKQALPSKGDLGAVSQDLHKMAAALERNRKEALAAYEQLELRAQQAEELAADPELKKSS